MDVQQSIIKKIAEKYNIDHRVCKEIVNSPFVYLKYLITSSNIEDGLRIPYFGAFCQKGNYNNKTMRTSNRVKELLNNIELVSSMMVSTLGFELASVSSAERVLKEALEAKDYDKINMIWEGWLDYNGKNYKDESI